MSTLVFTANEMLRRRKRGPFNFISPAPPLLSTPGATRHREKETLRRFTSVLGSYLLPRSSASPSKGTSKICLLSRCSPSLNASRDASSIFAVRNGASYKTSPCTRFFYCSSNPPLTQRHIHKFQGRKIILSRHKMDGNTRIRNVTQFNV